MTTARGTHVALLRGINVGGKNMLPMKELVAMFERAGCGNVRHYIQSGNVVFDAPDAVMKELAGVVQADIARRLGLRVPVVLRSAREMRAVVKNNPLLASGAGEDTCFVMFLADKPAPGSVSALDPQRSPPDVFVVRGREIYLSLVNGAGKSKLTNAWFDTKLGTISTSRNWRTVLRVVEMCGEG